MVGCLRAVGPWAEPGLEVVLAAQVPLAELPDPADGECPVPAVQPGGPDGAPVPQVQPVGVHGEVVGQPEPGVVLRLLLP